MFPSSFSPKDVVRSVPQKSYQPGVASSKRHAGSDSTSFLGNHKQSSSSRQPALGTVEQIVDSLPPEDKKNLTRFWRGLLTDPNGSMAFTLFKDKPVTQNEGAISTDLLDGANSPVSAWKRLREYFPSRKFHLSVKDRDSNDFRLQEFVMFNKPAAKEIIRKNMDNMYAVTGLNDKQEILNYLLSETDAQGFEGFNQALDNDDELVGASMGFCESDIQAYDNPQVDKANSQAIMPYRNHRHPVRYPEYMAAVREPESQRKFWDIVRQRDEIETDLIPDDRSIKSTDSTFLKTVLKRWTS